MKFRLLTALFLTCLSTWSLAAAPLRFATEATYPPFEYIDESGEIKGFDIDIAKALCEKINTTCTFSNQSFNSLIPSLKLGKFDVLIAALNVTPARQQQVDFTQAYYEPSASFVAPLDKNYNLSDLVGKTVGAQQGSVFEKYLSDKYGRTITVKTYSSIQEAFLDLNAGRVDLVIADTPIATAWLKLNNKQFGIVGKPIIDHVYFGTGYGIAVKKNNTELLNSLNKALDEIKADGTYNKIVTKYFGTK